MTVPTQPVTVRLADFGGDSVAGVTVTARLSAVDYTADGTFVSTEPVTGVTNVNGEVVLQLFPNALIPTGLGTVGTTVRVRATLPNSRQLSVKAVIPNEPCSLASHVVTQEPTGLSGSELAAAESIAAKDLAKKWATQTTAEVEAGQGYGAKKYAQDVAALAAQIDVDLDAIALIGEEAANNAADALTHKNAAELAKVAAEAARDNINTTGKVFTDTAAGIAGTSNGQSFAVLNADLLSWDVYKNNAGVAQFLASSYTKAYVDKTFDSTFNRPDRAFSVLDATNGEIAYIDQTGHLVVLGVDVYQAAVDMEATINPDTSYLLSGYAMPFVDAVNGLMGGFDSSGYFKQRGPLGTIGRSIDLFAAYGHRDKETVGLREIVCEGDSLTQGSGAGAADSYPTMLATLTGWPVANRGVSAYNAERIAVVQGGLVPLLTFPSNTIPSSGAVNVTSYTHPMRGDLGPQTITGYLQSGGTKIPGTVTRTGLVGGVDAYTFTRTTPGGVIEVDPKTPFIVDQFDDDYKIQVWWSGRNGFAADPTGTQLIAYYKLQLALLKPALKKFVILGIINGTTGVNEYPGGSGETSYNQIVAINDALKEEFPNNFIDIRKQLIRNYNPALPQDVIDYGRDVVPTSMTTDGLHLNQAIGKPIVAQAVFNFLTLKGWLA